MTKEHIQQLTSVKDVWNIVQKNSTTFLHADNMAFLRWCKEEMMRGYFHVGIVDPPYGIDVTKMNLGGTKDTVRDYERGQWDGEVPTPEYWELLRYVCRKIIVWGGNYFSNEIPPGRCFIVWDKMNDKMSFASGELALTTFDKNAVIIRRPRNAKGTDETEKRHDTQKPVYLYDYLHLNFVEKRQRVLDTHGGSFNHAVAALKNGVELTIMDKNESYFITGIDACEKELNSPRLLF